MEVRMVAVVVALIEVVAVMEVRMVAVEVAVMVAVVVAVMVAVIVVAVMVTVIVVVPVVAEARKCIDGGRDNIKICLRESNNVHIKGGGWGSQFLFVVGGGFLYIYEYVYTYITNC